MIRFFMMTAALLMSGIPVLAGERGEASLLELCDAFGETPAECACYMGEVKQVFADKDIELAGGVARAFMLGEEPEAIAAYLLISRKITIRHANHLYQLGDQHSRRVGKKCEDRHQKVTPAMQAKRKAMEARLEALGRRYRVGQ